MLYSEKRCLTRNQFDILFLLIMRILNWLGVGSVKIKLRQCLQSRSNLNQSGKEERYINQNSVLANYRKNTFCASSWMLTAIHHK